MGGRGWKDTLAQLSGPAVSGIEKVFWEAWAASTPVSGAAEPCLTVSEPAKAGDKRVSVVFAGGIRNVRSIRRSYRYAIDRSMEFIHITNAYFLPDRLVYRRLVKAAQRGVDVRIIAPRETDYPYVRLASWAMYAHLIKNGVKIYEWQGAILHSKTAVIDGVWSSVGSHNLDHRSLHYNLEVNLNVYDRPFGAAMTRAFREDLKQSKLITLEEVRNRPFTSKAASKFLYMFRSWL
jgi:cardiolipin synthase